MSLHEQIEQKLVQNFNISWFALENESHLHSGDAPESHFKLTFVAEEFEGLNKVKRHQLVYKTLADEMPLFHALALHTFAPSEWQEKVPESTPCRGGHAEVVSK